MTSLLDHTLSLAEKRVKFFPVIPNSKLPAIDDFSKRATLQTEELIRMFKGTDYNSGIATGFMDANLYLVGVDIDDREGKRGYEAIKKLESEGKLFPETWAQKTPSGGEHRLYWSPIPIRQGTNVIGVGIDTRGDGGYLVGPGSKIDGRKYTPVNNKGIALFPEWAIDAFKKVEKVISITSSPGYKPVQNQVLALKQSVDYLNSLESPAVAGSRNDSAYKVVCKLKDFGLAHDQIIDVLLEYWKCEPMLGMEELTHVVNSAFKYGGNSIGVQAPEFMFDELPVEEKPKGKDDTLHPFLEMNKNHFYVASDGVSRVCWETEKYGQFHLERFPVHQFHEKYGHLTMQYGKGYQPVTQLWIKAPERRSYDFIHFDPANTDSVNRFYNLWKGFRIKVPTKPKIYTKRAEESVKLFLEHCLNNVCAGDQKLNDWLITFFAHMFQKPGEKPLVALVFKGRKGIGKSALIDRLSYMIGKYAVTVADRTHLTNHFNSIMEDKILFVLDEALWAGDKSSEGILKHVITGKKRVITHKGAAPYEASVYDRIAIIGNEDWLVPATNDERRFAVFNVGEARKGDSRFFVDMRKGLEEEAGAELLMKYFMEWDLNTADVNVAPDTIGLEEQKEISMGVFEQWWKNCLEEERVIGSGLDEWPLTPMKISDFYEAFVRTMERNRVRGYIPNKYVTGKIFSRISPSIGGRSKVTSKSGDSYRHYNFIPIEIAQLEFDNYIGHKNDW